MSLGIEDDDDTRPGGICADLGMFLGIVNIDCRVIRGLTGPG